MSTGLGTGFARSGNSVLYVMLNQEMTSPDATPSSSKDNHIFDQLQRNMIFCLVGCQRIASLAQ